MRLPRPVRHGDARHQPAPTVPLGRAANTPGVHLRSRTVNELPFPTLLYRYFFFQWLFKDVELSGTGMFERAAVVRHNRRQANWLPTYMLRWLWCALLLYGLGSGCDLAFDATVAARWFYAASAMCVSFTITIATAWVGLTQRREA
jgi:hypothetical protein